jgi:hypothetical protein
LHNDFYYKSTRDSPILLSLKTHIFKKYHD